LVIAEGRIVVLISGSGSNMEALVTACERGEVPGRVVAVGADRDCAGVARARKRGVDAWVTKPADYPDRESWGAALRGRIEDRSPDLVVSAGFMRLLPPSFVDRFEGRLINLHPSLLPHFPGAHAVRDALAAEVTETGTTVHFIDHGVDTGRVLVQEKVPVRPGDTEATLHARIKEAEHRLLPEVCRRLLTS
jgi:phosphoribosylglycinamide formyltransferase-1